MGEEEVKSTLRECFKRVLVNRERTLPVIYKPQAMFRSGTFNGYFYRIRDTQKLVLTLRISIFQSSPRDPMHEFDAGPHEAGCGDAFFAGRALLGTNIMELICIFFFVMVRCPSTKNKVQMALQLGRG